MHEPANSIETDILTTSSSNVRRGPDKARRLSDAALLLLRHAANREDRMVLPPPAALRARGGALTVLLAHLLDRRLVEELPVDAEGKSWRRDDTVSWMGLRISAHGLTVIDAQAQPELQSSDGQAEGRELSGQPAAGNLADLTPVEGKPIEAASEVPESTPPSLEAAPRRTSKQDQIVALLGRAEGASLETLMATTDWLPHTVRAALSGLRKKGHRITHRRSESGTAVYIIEPPATVPAGDLQ